MRSERKQRHSLSAKVAEKSANRQNGRRGNSYLLLPDGVEMFKPDKEGNRRFNIIPYVAGKNNRDTDAGELDYEFTFFVHRIGEGDEQKTIVCPKKTFGKPCPICEQVEKLSKDYAENEDEIKSLKAKQRQLFNIIDARDEDNKIQIYETSYFKGFGEMLDKRLKSADEDDDADYRNFADIPGGLTLKVMYTEETFNGNKFFAPSSIDFVSRKEELPDSVIDEAVCLDSCLKVLSYNDIVKLIAGTDEDIDEDDVEEEKEVKKPSPKRGMQSKPEKAKKEEPVDDDEDFDDEEEQEEAAKPTKRKETKKPLKGEPDEDDADEEDDEEEQEEKPSKKSRIIEDNDEDEDFDDEDEEEKPVKKSKKTVKPSENEEEEEEEEEKKTSKKPVKKGGKCPHGYTWGADCYVYSECDDCPLCDECDAAQDE